MDEEGSNLLRTQIYAKLQEKSTEELLEIWNQQDREEWTDLAFGVIEEILMARTGGLPEPQQISGEREEEQSEIEKRLDRIATWAKGLSGAVLGLAIVVFIAMLITGINQGMDFGVFLIMILGALMNLLVGATFIVILQALAELLALQKNIHVKRDR